MIEILLTLVIVELGAVIYLLSRVAGFLSAVKESPAPSLAHAVAEATRHIFDPENQPMVVQAWDDQYVGDEDVDEES